MSGRLRVILPTVNVAVASILLGIGYTRPLVYWSPVPWEVALCFSINAPANLLRNLVWFEWGKHVQPHCSLANVENCIKFERVIETALFLLAVAFVWYVVGLEIEATRKGTRAMACFGVPARVLVDLVLFSVGSLGVVQPGADWRSWQLPFRSRADLGVLFYLAWSLALVIPYGHDLIRRIASLRKPGGA